MDLRSRILGSEVLGLRVQGSGFGVEVLGLRLQVAGFTRDGPRGSGYAT